MEWIVVAIPVAALVALFGPSRYGTKPLHSPAPSSPPDDGPPTIGVREPRRPSPQPDGAAAAIDPPTASSPG